MIQIGERIPEVNLWQLGPEGVRAVPTQRVFAGRRVVLFGVPGAFTPTCSDTHLPGFVLRAGEVRAKGVDSIVCVAVNDPHVMAAWGRVQRAAGAVEMLADGNGELARGLGLEVDLRASGLGTRMRRFAALVEDGVVKQLFVESRPGVDVSGVESILAALG